MANNVEPDQTGSALFAQAYLSENLGSLWYCLLQKPHQGSRQSLRFFQHIHSRHLCALSPFPLTVWSLSTYRSEPNLLMHLSYIFIPIYSNYIIHFLTKNMPFVPDDIQTGQIICRNNHLVCKHRGIPITLGYGRAFTCCAGSRFVIGGLWFDFFFIYVFYLSHSLVRQMSMVDWHLIMYYWMCLFVLHLAYGIHHIWPTVCKISTKETKKKKKKNAYYY